MRLTQVILLTVVLVSCTESHVRDKANQQTNHSEGLDKRSFLEYLDQIPVLETGWRLACDEEINPVELPPNEFQPEGAAIIGRLESTMDRHGIIYGYPADILLPILEVYNDNAEKLKAVELLDPSHCSFENEEETSRFRILEGGRLLLEHCRISGDDSIVLSSKVLDVNHL